MENNNKETIKLLNSITFVIIITFWINVVANYTSLKAIR